MRCKASLSVAVCDVSLFNLCEPLYVFDVFEHICVFDGNLLNLCCSCDRS
jgi:hypothetical protein